jgi:hypothetical protein
MTRIHLLVTYLLSINKDVDRLEQPEKSYGFARTKTCPGQQPEMKDTGVQDFLFEKSQKIYPRQVSGVFAGLRTTGVIRAAGYLLWPAVVAI